MHVYRSMFLYHPKQLIPIIKYKTITILTNKLLQDSIRLRYHLNEKRDDIQFNADVLEKIKDPKRIDVVKRIKFTGFDSVEEIADVLCNDTKFNRDYTRLCKYGLDPTHFRKRDYKFALYLYTLSIRSHWLDWRIGGYYNKLLEEVQTNIFLKDIERLILV